MKTPYKIRARFFKGLLKREIDVLDLSGQEMQSLEDTVRGFMPGHGWMKVDWDTFDITLDNETVPVVFPEDWLNENLNKNFSIAPGQYGLRAWPSRMYVRFEISN